MKTIMLLFFMYWVSLKEMDIVLPNKEALIHISLKNTYNKDTYSCSDCHDEHSGMTLVLEKEGNCGCKKKQSHKYL